LEVKFSKIFTVRFQENSDRQRGIAKVTDGFERKPVGTRIRGRPQKGWIADIEEDMQIMGIRRWRNQCKKSAEWKRTTEKA
jgi:hypothetical protein